MESILQYNIWNGGYNSSRFPENISYLKDKNFHLEKDLKINENSNLWCDWFYWAKSS